VTGRKDDGVVHAAHRGGDRRRSERRQPRGHAGNDLVVAPGLAQRLRLLAAAAEHEGVAALEPHDVEALARRLVKLRVDAVLPDAGLAAPLANKHTLGIAPRTIENLGRDQLVIEHDIGALQRLLAEPRYAVLARWVTAIDLSGALAPEDYYVLDGHMRPSGHEKVARLVAVELERRTRLNR
jgi:hypothetical protein